MLIAAPADLFDATTALGDLADARWASEPAETSCGAAFRQACRALGFEPDVRFTSTEFGVLLRSVAAGAVALVPQVAVLETPPGVQLLPMNGADMRRHVFVCHRRGSAKRASISLVLDRLVQATEILKVQLRADLLRRTSQNGRGTPVESAFSGASEQR
jgi:hypothetical protein